MHHQLLIECNADINIYLTLLYLFELKEKIYLSTFHTKVSAKIRTQEDTERLQQDLDRIYTWADENLMEFNENKFEKMSHGYTKNVNKGEYKTKSGQLIEESKTVKDLGILTSKDVFFAEHLEELVLSSTVGSRFASSPPHNPIFPVNQARTYQARVKRINLATHVDKTYESHAEKNYQVVKLDLEK